MRRCSIWLGATIAVSVLVIACNLSFGAWERHTIDRSSKGADGVRLADVDGDGLRDVVTGWEEGGVVRVYRNPGPAGAKRPWVQVTVGQVSEVEDAVLVDLNGDHRWEVLSSCEGRTRAMFVHQCATGADWWANSSWRTTPLPVTVDRMQWMYCLPLMRNPGGLTLVAGGKNKDAGIGWFALPRDPWRVSDWRWHRLRDAGWVMSLAAADMDGDGDQDLVFSDRKGARRGCFWLERPAAADQVGAWREHAIGGLGQEVMFLTLADLDMDGLEDVIVACKPRQILFQKRCGRDGREWRSHPIAIPSAAGTAKAVQVGDLDRDGRQDLVFTCEGAEGRSGVMWLSWGESVSDVVWTAHDISGVDGVKYDLLELLDLDGDGDLDVITCEETRNLGVIWYENRLPAPSR